MCHLFHFLIQFSLQFKTYTSLIITNDEYLMIQVSNTLGVIYIICLIGMEETQTATNSSFTAHISVANIPRFGVDLKYESLKNYLDTISVI